MNKKYTLEEFKEMFRKAEMEVLSNPTEGLDIEDGDGNTKVVLLVAGMLITTKMRKKLFGEKEQ